MKKIKEIRQEILPLKKDVKQKIVITENKKMPLFARKDKIYADKDFWNKLNKEEKISTIYHERGHTTKIGIGILNFSNIFIIMGAILIALFIVENVAFKLFTKAGIKYSYLSINLFDFHYLLMGIFIILLGALSKWFSETICDANAIKNGEVKSFKSSLEKCYKYGEKNRNFIEKLENNYLSHVPKKLRFKIIENWEEG